MNYSIAAAFVVAAIAVADRPLFSTNSPVELTLRAPLQELFDKGTTDDKFTTTGVLSYKDPASGAEARIPEVELSVRGHTSKRETECSFPKLKIKFRNADARDASIFAGADGVRIGTHCGETEGEEQTPKFGRLANEKSPLREVFVYQLLDAMGVPAMKARAARITYVDTDVSGPPVVRHAMLLEDEDDARGRLGGTGEITEEQFTNARAQLAPEDTARLALAQAMIGNFDWCLAFYPGDTYRCDADHPLWNITVFERAGGQPAVPVMADFDLAGMVVGRHSWFEKVYFEGFVPSRSHVEIEVLSQVQRTRSLFSRRELDAARRHFLERKPAAHAALERSGLDPRGRELAREHLDAFFGAIADEAFYRPVITKPGAAVYIDAAKSQEACAPGDFALRGSPVNVITSDGGMAQVTLLDALWRWGWGAAGCKAIATGPVWIEADAIGTDYPTGERSQR